MNLTYRPAKPLDAPQIFEQAKALVERYEDPNQVDFEKVLPWLERKVCSNILAYTCVYADGVKVGFYNLDLSGDMAELDDLYILPEYRNQGIGTKVLEHCISTTEKTIFLYVFLKNNGAIRLYSRMGFVQDREVSMTRAIMVRKG